MLEGLVVTLWISKRVQCLWSVKDNEIFFQFLSSGSGRTRQITFPFQIIFKKPTAGAEMAIGLVINTERYIEKPCAKLEEKENMGIKEQSLQLNTW